MNCAAIHPEIDQVDVLVDNGALIESTEMSLDRWLCLRRRGFSPELALDRVFGQEIEPEVLTVKGWSIQMSLGWIDGFAMSGA